MATSRFSLTLFWPMNSCKRCGRSLSSNEESSSTGAAETRRSLRLGFDEATAPDVNTKQVDMMLAPPGRAGKGAMFHRAKRTLGPRTAMKRSEEHTSELQSLRHLVCRL